MSETEILVTYDNEVLEVGENGDVESVDAYLAETYDEEEISTFATGYGYLTNGTLRVISSGCSTASVDYFKNSGSNVTVNFHVRYASGSTTSSSPWQTAGARTGWTFSLSGSQNVQGGMRLVDGTTYYTQTVSCR